MRNLFDTYKQHYKALLLLGLPIVVGQLGVIVLGFADTLIYQVHHILYDCLNQES